MDEAVKKWADLANSDLESARALQASKRNLHCLFFCQQAIEKALKAVILSKTQKLPPRIHNLSRLADLAGLSLEQDRRRLLAQFSQFYIESRYPEEISKLAASTTSAEAQRGLDQAEEIVQWLLSTLT